MAYLLASGSTQAAAAKATGMSQRSVERWVKCSWWGEAMHEATARWLPGLKSLAMSRLMRDLEKNPDSADRALRVLERLIPDLAPPRQRLEHTGEDGGPIETREVSDEELLRRAARLKNRLLVSALPQPNGNGNGNGKH